jgi:hypothetical protein
MAALSIRDAIENLALQLREGQHVNQTLELLTHTAVDTIEGVDYASLSLRRGNGPVETLAPTHPVAVVIDELQYELQEGPCYEVVTDKPFVMTNSLAHDSRWPAFAPRAADLGIGSQLALVLIAEPDTRASLNLYAERVNVFNGNVADADWSASHAALILNFSQAFRQLDSASGSREVIGQAVGIIMERHTMRSDEAFGHLAGLSQTTSVSLRQVATEIVRRADIGIA